MPVRPLILTLALTPALAPATAAPTPRGQVVAIACTGAIATQARKVAKADGLKLGQQPKACFGQMQIYDGPNRQFVVVAPSAACSGGKLLDVYGQSNAGPWYSYFEKPLCGSRVSIGPKNQWGDWMLTIDGKHYTSRGAYYVPAP